MLWLVVKPQKCGMYHGEDYDVAGFCVGVVEKSEIIDGTKVTDGDVLIALGSSGPHSNGYSLVRKILKSVVAIHKPRSLLVNH